MSEVFTSVAAAHRWLEDEGYGLTERTLGNHLKDGLCQAERYRNGKVKQITLAQLEKYARMHLVKTLPQGPQLDLKARLIKEQADKIELENAKKRGELINLAEEEQRDAMILAGFRRHLENSAADRLQGLLNDILKTVKDEKLRSEIVARQPGWLQQDLDLLADIFDGFVGV